MIYDNITPPDLHQTPFSFGRSSLQHVTAHDRLRPISAALTGGLARLGPRQPRMEGKRGSNMWPTNLSAPSHCPCASNRRRTPKAPRGGLRAPPADPWPAEAAWNRPGAIPPCLFPDAGPSLAGPPCPSFLPTLTQPREGLCAPKYRPSTLLGGQADKFQLQANRLFAYVPRPKSMGQRPN